MKKTLLRLAVVGAVALAVAGCKKEEAPAATETASAEAAPAADSSAPAPEETTTGADDMNHTDGRGSGGN